MRVVWTEDALGDLEETYRFLAQVNRRAAAKTHNRILDEAALLATHPKLGKIEPILDDLPGERRSLVVGRKYKIIYKIDDPVVYITVIWDCRRNPLTLRKIAEQDNGTD
jgi:plasmid stabilization system protein ParE